MSAANTNLTEICETYDSYSVYGFSVGDCADPQPGNILSVWCGWGQDITKIEGMYCTLLHDGTLALEYGSAADPPSEGDLCYGHCGDVDESEVQFISNEKAAPFLGFLATKAFITEESVVWDNVTQGYYTSADLPQYVFWSKSEGYFAGPGYGDGRLSGAFSDIKEDLWPVFDLMGVSMARELQTVLKSKVRRKIEIGFNFSVYEAWGGKHFHFDLANAGWDYRDAFNWLLSLSGESLPGMKTAEEDTIAEIDKWLVSLPTQATNREGSTDLATTESGFD